jgi:hypothetical protein
MADARLLNRKAQSLKGAVPYERLRRGADEGMGVSAAAVNDMMMAGILGVLVMIVGIAVMVACLLRVCV